MKRKLKYIQKFFLKLNNLYNDLICNLLRLNIVEKYKQDLISDNCFGKEIQHLVEKRRIQV